MSSLIAFPPFFDCSYFLIILTIWQVFPNSLQSKKVEIQSLLFIDYFDLTGLSARDLTAALMVSA